MLGTRTIDTGNARAAAVARGLAGAKCSVSGTNVLAASPRIWEVGAPRCRLFAGDRSIGATESFPRRSGSTPAPQRIDAVVVSSPRMEDASIAGLWGPRGTSRSLRTRCTGRAALGRCSMKGLMHSDRIGFMTQGIVEGVPCAWVAIGADRMCDDVVRVPGMRREGLSRSSLGPSVMCG